MATDLFVPSALNPTSASDIAPVLASVPNRVNGNVPDHRPGAGEALITSVGAGVGVNVGSGELGVVGRVAPGASVGKACGVGIAGSAGPG